MAKRPQPPEKPSRRQFLKKAAASTIASGALLSSCGPPKEPEKPALRPLNDDPHSPLNLPGRDNYRTPPDWEPSIRTNWGAKNVIVIMLDSFRADHLGAFGNSKVPTPHLDQFAAESTFFSRSYPEGLPTIPVRTSLFTGKFTYPFRPWQVLHPEDHPLLAEILWSEGFRSCLVSDVYHMHKPGYGFSRGFDDVIWLRGQEGDPFVRDPGVKVDIEPFYKSRSGQPQEQEQIRQYLSNRHDWKGEDDHFTPRVMGHALDWLKRQERKENLFLWIDSFCPHEPWDPPDRFLKQIAPNFAGKKLILPTPGDAAGYLDAGEMTNIMSLYGAVVAFVDQCVGDFLSEIKRMGLYENTMIVLATDHGEPFGEHGIVRKVRPWAYEELAHTFLMIREPGGQGVPRVDSYTQQTDITATLLDYLGIATPPRMTSRSLLPLILGEEEKIRDFAVCCHYGKSINVRHDDWSYHYFLDGEAKQREDSKLTKGGPEIYNTIDDPGEHHNLIAAEPEKAKVMDQMARDLTQELVEHEQKYV
ncbi:MAG: sulfatase-like hydrolase/transferase [Acidobacteria bacterium]|nr:sulfatase-like hydrolase/transferase [Acidobacteriota bacterium]